MTYRDPGICRVKGPMDLIRFEREGEAMNRPLEPVVVLYTFPDRQESNHASDAEWKRAKGLACDGPGRLNLPGVPSRSGATVDPTRARSVSLVSGARYPRECLCHEAGEVITAGVRFA